MATSAVNPFTGPLVLGFFAEPILLDLPAPTIIAAMQTSHYIKNCIKSSYKLTRRITKYKSFYKRTGLTAPDLHEVLLTSCEKDIILCRDVSCVFKDCIDTSTEMRELLNNIPIILIPRRHGLEVNPSLGLALAAQGYSVHVRADNGHNANIPDELSRFTLTLSTTPGPSQEEIDRYQLRKDAATRQLLPKQPVKVEHSDSAQNFDLEVHEATFGGIMTRMGGRNRESVCLNRNLKDAKLTLRRDGKDIVLWSRTLKA